MPKGTHMRVNLKVPNWATPGETMSATAAGQTFTVTVPPHLKPGQYFTVRVPIKGAGGEQKAPDVAAPEVNFLLEPNIVIGPDKYFKEVKKCSDWCDCSRCCCPYVNFSGKELDIMMQHECCCLPCCCNFTIGTQKTGHSSVRNIGTLAPASCSDQNCMACFCPCCYSGPKMQTKFLDATGSIRFMLKSNVEWCQYCAIFCCLCSPCFRCYRFCCKDAQYTRYEQTVYGTDLNDNTPYAKIVYTDRMICPCWCDERIQMKIEPAEGKSLTKEDLILLSVYPTLASGYTCIEFCCPLWIPGGMMCSMPLPSGVEMTDDANNIQGEYMNIKEALDDRRMAEMY